MNFVDFIHLGGEHWRSHSNFLVSLFFRLFGPLGVGTRIRAARVLKELEGSDLNGCRVLDVGMGLGYALFYLARQYPEAYLEGIDIDINRVSMCQAISRETGLGINFHHIPIEEVSDESEFDVILSADVLEHIDEDVEMIRHMAIKLRSRGKLVIHVPLRHQLQKRFFSVFKNHIIEDHVRDEYTKEEIVAKVEQAGLEIFKVGYGFGTLGELSLELNNLFWENPGLRALTAFLTFPISLILGYLDGKRNLSSGNSIIVVARRS